MKYLGDIQVDMLNSQSGGHIDINPCIQLIFIDYPLHASHSIENYTDQKILNLNSLLEEFKTCETMVEGIGYREVRVWDVGYDTCLQIFEKMKIEPKSVLFRMCNKYQHVKLLGKQNFTWYKK